MKVERAGKIAEGDNHDDTWMTMTRSIKRTVGVGNMGGLI